MSCESHDRGLCNIRGICVEVLSPYVQDSTRQLTVVLESIYKDLPDLNTSGYSAKLLAKFVAAKLRCVCVNTSGV